MYFLSNRFMKMCYAQNGDVLRGKFISAFQLESSLDSLSQYVQGFEEKGEEETDFSEDDLFCYKARKSLF